MADKSTDSIRRRMGKRGRPTPSWDAISDHSQQVTNSTGIVRLLGSHTMRLPTKRQSSPRLRQTWTKVQGCRWTSWRQPSGETITVSFATKVSERHPPLVDGFAEASHGHGGEQKTPATRVPAWRQRPCQHTPLPAQLLGWRKREVRA